MKGQKNHETFNNYNYFCSLTDRQTEYISLKSCWNIHKTTELL